MFGNVYGYPSDIVTGDIYAPQLGQTYYLNYMDSVVPAA